MGTRSDMGRGRRDKRGLASFISFLLLFAFALGQGSSLFALADTDPVATEDVVADGTVPAEEAPAEEAPAEEAPAEEAPATSDDDASDPAPAVRSDQLNVARVSRGAAVAAPVVEVEALVDTPGAPSGDGVQPVLLIGNQNCAEIVGDALLFEYRHEPPVDASVDLAVESDGLVQGTLEIDVHGSLFDFTVVDGDAVAAVVVKGGNNANLFDYRPGGNLADTDLHAPVNPQNNEFYGLSHISFCWVEEPKVPDIDVEKTCTEFAQVGDTITYTITVTNTGDEDLEGITVDDTLLGDLSDDFADTLAAGDSESHDFDYLVTDQSPDPVPNSVTATGTGVDSEEVVDDSAGCETDILNPDIDVEKSCTEFAQVGDTITYTITVTNTGDEDLEGITVDDTLLGDLSDDFADTLAAGDSESHDFDYLVTDQSPDPVPNSVTATGTGVDSEEVVTDTASCSTDLLFPAINIVKDGPELVHRGDTITYTFVVTNPGEVELFDVELTDPICDPGTIDPGAEVDASLAVGEVWTFSCTHLVTEDDPDPIPNTATVRGDTEEGEGGNEVTDTDDHVVDIINPAIDILKTVDEEIVPIGTTVTFTYVVTNTGDTTLYEISVDDDILGHIGDIAVLEPGDSATLTKDFVVGDEPVTNVGTAEGEDVLGRSVSADDDATVTPIAGENPPNPPNNPPTPFTGSDAGRLGLITIVLFGIGVTVVASTRRRRPEREAA